MDKIEKELLFKDLCARLPYEVVIHTDWKDVKLDHDHCNIGMLYYERYSEEAKKECGYDENDCSIIISGCYYGGVKPYLRPMSSMTEDEEIDFTFLSEEILSVGKNDDTCVLSVGQIDWLNAHHFDYRGLIEKGLALEAKEGMYKQ